ncbi:MAG: NADH:flavin oxidoreductase [Candidatus Bathyarchaeia archaeon]
MVSLLDPLEIKGLHLKNRIVMPPMASDLASESGEVTEALIDHYRRRCRSVGLVIVEHSYIRLEGKYSVRQLGIYGDHLLDGLSRLVKAIHKLDVPVAIQINHAGRRATSKVCKTQPVAPSPIPEIESGETPRELTVEDICSIVKDFGSASRRALKAGFDAVEIHGAHGFLLNQFCSPITNRRSDRYGGGLENRMRFPLEVAAEVVGEVGENIPVFYRLGADDMMPGGLTLDDSRKIAKSLVDNGVSVIDVSGGLCGSRPPNLHGEGYFTRLAESIRQAVNVPVVTTGGIRTARFADEVIMRGVADLVGVGRALLSDPDWAEKAVESLRSSRG